MTTPGDPGILLVHNYYRRRSGEDISFDLEVSLLESHGHRVVKYTRSSDEIGRAGPAARALLPLTAVRAGRALREIAETLRRESPILAHFQNTFPLISPAAYGTCVRHGIAVVQTLRNYRLLCSKATLYRNGSICELCLPLRIKWPAVLHACYHSSRSQSTAVSSMLALHHLRGTWRTQVDMFIALSDFSRRKFIEGGIPADRVVVKPNCAEDPGPASPTPADGTILFVGRLDEEKGVEDLIKAASIIGAGQRVRIAGTGPLTAPLKELARDTLAPPAFLGHLTGDDLAREWRKAAIVVVPSRNYESFGRAVVEAYAFGRAVVASRHGGVAELVEDGSTGRLFTPADPADLASVLSDLLSRPQDLVEMGARARARYVARYTPSVNYLLLAGIYRTTLERRGDCIPEAFKRVPPGDPSRPPHEWAETTH